MTTAVSLAPTPILQFFNNAGQFNAGGSILTQVGGVNYPTYQDSAGTIPLPNPIPLNSRGEVSNAAGVSCQLFLAAGVVYTFTMYDASGNQIDQATNVSVGTNSATVVPYTPPGSGAVATTIANALNQIVYLAPLYGFLTSNTAVQNTTAFNALVAIVVAAGGGNIRIPAGNYSINSLAPIIGSNITISGDGMGATILNLVAGSNGDAISFGNNSTYVRDLYVKDLRITGNGASQSSGNGVHFMGCEGMHVTGCEIAGCYGAGILVEGVSARNSPYLFVGDCYINTNLGSGIQMGTSTNFHAYSATIWGCLIAGNGATGTQAGFFATSNDTHRITGCLFDSNYYGVYTNACSDTCVTGCVFEQNNFSSVLHYLGTRHVVTGNKILDSSNNPVNTYAGIDISSSTYCTITGNHISADTVVSAYGINEHGTSNYNNITGNTIGGGGSTITNVLTLVGLNTNCSSNIGYNPVGAITFAIPASGTAATNTYSVPATVYVWGGTVSSIAINGLTTTLTSGAFRIMPGQTLTIAYSAAPGYKWFLD